MFIDIYLNICQSAGVAPTTVLQELGISKSAYSNWKNGGEPSNRTKKAIAEYFGITVSELMSGEVKAHVDEPGEHDEMAELLNEFRDNPELRTLFSLTTKANPKELRKYIDVIKAIRGSNNGGEDY